MPRCSRSAPTELAPEVVDETLGVILKYEEDIRQVRGETAAPLPGRGDLRPALTRARREASVHDPAVVARPVRRGGRRPPAARRRRSSSGGRSAARARRRPRAAVDFARALTLVDIGDREQVKAAGEAIFVRRQDDLEVYDRVFELFWRAAGSAAAVG